MMNAAHISVLVSEAIEALRIQPGRWYVDATFGRGGHTQAILDQGGKVVGFDFDEETIDRGRRRFSEALEANTLILVRENFDKLAEKLSKLAKTGSITFPVSGILFDLGTSTDQLMSAERGLSFENEAAQLDMRLDNRLGVKASDLLKILSQKQLSEVFWELGGEEQANRIAKAIVKARETDPAKLETVGSLVTLIMANKPRRFGKLHPATKVFQALRIAVNDELDNLSRALPQALESLAPKGRIVTIAFHEGEDRPVKHAFAQWEEQGRGTRITKKPLSPSEAELRTNPRSRSAKLRIFERSSK